MTQISTWLPNLRDLNNYSAIRGLRKSFWGFADQALISGVNFVVMILLARQLGPKAFGAFVVAYTVLIFANSIQIPLFTAPHNVLGATRAGSAYSHYTTSTAIAQSIFSCAAGLVISLIGLGALVINHPSAWLLLALAPTCIAWQMQEFIRRVLYTHSDYKGAFLNDLIAYGGQFIGIALLIGFSHLNAVSAVLIVGAANIAGAVVGSWRIRPFLTRVLDRSTVRKELMENWIFGRWLLGSSLTSWVSGQLYPLLTAGLVGTMATGGMRAAQTVMGPTHVLLKSMEAVIPPRAARVYDTAGILGLKAYIRKVALPGVIAMALYCAIVAFWAGPLVRLLLGPGYESYIWILQMFAASYLSIFFSSLVSIALRSARVTAPMFRAYVWSAVIVLTFGVWAVYAFGLKGAVSGIVVHSLVLNVVLWRCFFRLNDPGQE